jgi:trans-aconitate methyltransferase
MADKPKQFGQAHASIFQDASVVAAYQYRPPYPPETFSFLLSLIPATAAERIVLDAGCGTGFITRPFAAAVDHIDAVDISPAMIAAGPTLPGGDRPNITWQAAPIETAVLRPAYTLIVAAASLHWMDWEAALPRFARHLVPGGVLATVEERPQPNSWDADLGPIAQRYSMNQDYSSYDMATVTAELERRGLFQLHGSYETPPMRFQQSIDDWVESFHARNGFSRDRMGRRAADACDAALRAAVLPYSPNGFIEQHIAARILWGAPLVRK